MLIETAMAIAAYTSTPADDLNAMEAMACNDSISFISGYSPVYIAEKVQEVVEGLLEHGNQSQHATPPVE
jgi:hypothetical protein